MTPEEIKKLLDEQKTLFEQFKKANEDKNVAAVEKLNTKISELETQLQSAIRQAEAAELLAKQRYDIEANRGNAAAVDPKVKEAFSKFLRKGPEGMTPDERHAMSGYSDPDGGYLVLPHISKAIIERIYLTSPMRQLADVETIGTNLFKEPIENTLADAKWTEREADGTETNTPRYGMLEVPVFGMEANPKVPLNLLEDASWDVEARLKNSLSIKFALLENTGFITGDGKGMPRGILSYTSGTDPSLGQIQQVTSGGATSITPDKLIDLVYTLKSGYRNGASWVMNALTQAAVRKLKDSQNQYLWQPGLQAGQPATLLGYPVVEFADMPDVAASSLSIAYGNFREGYKIIDHAKGFGVLPNPYSASGYMIWNARRRVGGAVKNHEAIKLMVTSA